MNEAWRVRPAKAEELAGILGLWMSSFWRSRYARSRYVCVDPKCERCRSGSTYSLHERACPARREYSDRHGDRVLRLLETSAVTVACDSEWPDVLLGFACTYNEVIHYVLVKRRFQGEGLGGEMIRDLLGDRLKSPQLYSHELPDLKRMGVTLPAQWRFDPYTLADTQGRHGVSLAYVRDSDPAT